MIRSKGEAGTGDIVEAVRHLRAITRRDPAPGHARRDGADRRRPRSTARRSTSSAASPRTASCPVPLFCAGGIATPADASLVMQLGAEAVFVGSGIFKSSDPATRAAAVVEATTHFDDPERVARGERGPRARRWSRSRRASSTRVSCSPAAAGDTGAAASASSPCRAASPRTRACCARWAPRCARCARRADLDGPRRAGHARRRVDDDDARHRARGPGRAAARLPAAGKPILGTCAGLILLDRDHLGLMDIVRRAQRLRPPAALLRGGPRVPRHRRRPGARGLHPRAVDRRARPGVEVLAAVDGHPVAARAGRRCWPSPSTPSSATTTACTARSSSRSARRAGAGARRLLDAVAAAWQALAPGRVESGSKRARPRAWRTVFSVTTRGSTKCSR